MSYNGLIDGEEMYFRIMTVNTNKKMPVHRIHSFELSPVPLSLSLFDDDGSMMATTKSDFLHKIEELVKDDIFTTAPSADCMVRDGHVSVQELQEANAATMESVTFNDMAHRYLDHVLGLRKRASKLHVVFDKYQT